MEKKIAILLFGFSKMDASITGKKTDYEKSYENYNEFIFNYFKEIGYDIDVYYVTNKLSMEDELILRNKYNPVKYMYTKYGRNVKLLNCCKLCLDSKIKYNLVLVTRFDLIFKKKFNESNIDFNKFNLVSILEKPHLICDNFYLMPYKYLNSFMDCLLQGGVRGSCGHFLKKYFDKVINEKNINYILNENVCVPELSFYKLGRHV